MAERVIIMINQKELKLLHVIHKVLEGTIAQAQAATLGSLSERQIRLLVKRIRAEGGEGVLHNSRGRESGRRLPMEVKDRVVNLYRQKYIGSRPTFIAEKLAEIDEFDTSVVVKTPSIQALRFLEDNSAVLGLYSSRSRGI